jgi:hypothetical protein
MTDIQGFPKDKKNITIVEMVEEMKEEDAKRAAREQHRKQNSAELDVIKRESLIRSTISKQ